MPLVTCGLLDEGVIASVVRFSTSNELIPFVEDFLEESFTVSTTQVEFTDKVQVINWDVDIIQIVGCTLP